MFFEIGFRDMDGPVHHGPVPADIMSDFFALIPLMQIDVVFHFPDIPVKEEVLQPGLVLHRVHGILR